MLARVLGVLTLVAGFWGLVPVAAAGWHLGACPGSASSDSASVPGIFSRSPSPEQLANNYVLEARERFTGRRERQRNHRRLVQTLERGDARLVVRRIEDWTPRPCHIDRRGDHRWLLQVFEAGENGGEIARLAFDSSGRWVGSTARSRGSRDDAVEFVPIPDLEVAAGTLRELWGLEARDLQYVEAFKVSPCGALRPCIAFREAETGDPHLYDIGWSKVYEIVDDGPRYPLASTHSQALYDLLEELCARDRHIVSVGGDSYMEMEEVAPRPGGGAR